MDEVSDDKRKQRRTKKAVGGFSVLCLFVLAFLWFVGVFGGNVRVVEPHDYIRTAQLSGPTLENVTTKYGIRSMINLRGAQTNDAAYDSELAICKDEGIQHADFDLSAYRLPPPEQIQGVVKSLDSFPRPVLVHCKGGSDRTGLVSTLYLNVYKNVPLDEAENKELTWRFGHLAFTSTKAMNRFFDLYRNTSNGADLRSWIFKTYPSVYAGEVAKHAPDVAAPKGKE